MTTNHNFILFFTNKGRVYKLKAYEIPEASRTARGTALVNLLQLMPEEHVTTVLPIREFGEEKFLIMATRRGLVKRTPLTAFSNIRKNGIAAIVLGAEDELIEVKWDDSEQDMLLVTRNGMSIRFNASDILPRSRMAGGVRGVSLAPGDEVVNMMTEKQGSHILFISENGLGKLTSMEEFKVQHRGGCGVKCYKITEKSGKLVGARAVSEDDELLLITTEGVMIRTSCASISILGRITTGVKIIDLEEGVTVASFTKVKEDETDPLYEEGEGENAAEEESRDNVTKETAEETPDDENG